jgi:hypothetical protein
MGGVLGITRVHCRGKGWNRRWGVWCRGATDSGGGAGSAGRRGGWTDGRLIVRLADDRERVFR